MNGYKQNMRPLQSITYLLSLLSLLTLIIAPPVFASTDHSLAEPLSISTPKDAAGAPTDQGFARASVSVVRLLASYADANDPNKTVVECTGLGVLVKSLPRSPSGSPMPNDWVLTDGSLVNANQPACSDKAGKLSQIQIFFNKTYHNSTPQVSFKIDRNSTPPVNGAISCSDSANCGNGAALIAFQGEEAPFVNLASSSSTPADHTAIALIDAKGLPSPQASNSTDAAQFLTPQSLDLNPKLEVGTPVIDAAGRFTRLASNSSTPLASISSLMEKQTPPGSENAVNTNWNKGIDDYYQKNYAAAQTDFNNAVSANSNFQGAKDFAKFAQNTLASSASQQTGSGISVFGIHIGLWESSVFVVVFFGLALSLAGMVIRPRVERRRAFRAERDAANHRAATVAREIERMEASQRDWIERHTVSRKPTFPIQQQALQDKALVLQQPREFRCPSCGEPITPDANYCPNCRQLLSPSEHRRIRPPATPAPAPSFTTLTPRTEFDAADIRADINANQLTKQEGD